MLAAVRCYDPNMPKIEKALLPPDDPAIFRSEHVRIEFNPMGKNIMRVIPDLTANAGDLWEWPPKKAGLFSALPAPIAHIDCVIPVLHGMNGEDGTVSGNMTMEGSYGTEH